MGDYKHHPQRVTCPKCGRKHRATIVTGLLGECFLCIVKEAKGENDDRD